MLKTFILIATIWNPSMTPADIAVSPSYVIDYNMSETDCLTVWLDVNQSAGFEIEPGVVVSPSNFILSCEPENAIAACEFEDSDNCAWNAQERGNGQGRSFIAWGGQVYYTN